MSSADSTIEPALLVVHSGDRSHAIEPGHGAVTIGCEPQADVQIVNPQISQKHLRAEPVDGLWRIVDNSPGGMFVEGRRTSSLTVSDTATVRFGDPTAGSVLRFEVVRPPRPAGRQQSSGSDDGDEGPSHTDELDPGVVRAGAAAAARRRELGISQRSLAGQGIVNAGALIAFEKGRSWPRDRTLAKLEQVLQWPPGTIVRIRRGHPVGTTTTSPVTANPSDTSAPAPSSDGPEALIAQAVATAVDGCGLAITGLPAAEHPEFSARAAPILHDLRQIEAIAVRATHISRITPELIRALGTVRRHYDRLMTLGASAPNAPLGQRLYAARRRANLSTRETAQAAGLAEEFIVRAEADETVPAHAAEAIEALINQITWG